MNKKRIFGEFVEVFIKEEVRIGECFYECNNTKLHKDGSFAEQQWYDFIYLGTDMKTIKIKFCYQFLRNNVRESSREDVLELPFNDKKQVVFEPRYELDMKKFLIELADDFGNLNIKICQ
jgi:hypothetical protein